MAAPQEGWKNAGLVKGPGIPAPSGQYRVGCVDLMHQLEGDDKGLLVRLHYPTEATPAAGYAYSKWYPHREYIKGYLSIEKQAKFVGVTSMIMKALSSPEVPALEQAPLFGSDCKEEPGASAAAPSFPVIVFSHGLCGMRTTYSGIVCDLASHGYVVACVEHRDESAAASLQRVPKRGGKEGELEDQWIKYLLHEAPKAYVDPVGNAEQEFPFRNKQVKQRADEVSKSLDILGLLNEGAEIKNMLEGSYNFKQFKGRMDVNTAAVVGHSFGGGTTIQTLATDARFKCGIALDSWIIPIESGIYDNNTSISQPLYFINAYKFQWRENMRRMLPMTRPEDASGMSPCRVLTIKGTIHLSQTDVPFVTNTSLVRLFNVEQSTLDPEVAHGINMEICHAFFKRHLLKDPAYQGLVPNLDGSEGHSEHILFGTNVKMEDEQSAEGEGPGEREEKGEGIEEAGPEGEAKEEEGPEGEREEKGEGIEEVGLEGEREEQLSEKTDQENL